MGILPVEVVLGYEVLGDCDSHCQNWGLGDPLLELGRDRAKVNSKSKAKE